MNPDLIAVKEAVWATIPEIKDLKNGCHIIVDWSYGTGVSLPFETIEWTDRTDMHDNGDGYIMEDNVDGKIIEILGRDIRCEDIFVTIIAVMGEKYGNSGKVFDDIVNEMFLSVLKNWHFNKDLNNQSPECWALLANILRK